MDDKTPRKQIPPERKALYYGGMVLIGIGLLLFLSVFVTFMANFGNFDNFEGRARSEGFRAFGGMILMMIGGFMMNVGSKGLAGSGVVLDPEEGRKDLEPWSRMGGGMIQDALSEVEVAKKLGERLDQPPPVPVVKVIGGAPPTGSGPKQLHFTKGEKVRFEIETAEPFSFEIKGLGITQSIDSTSMISFQANKAGQFPVIATATLIGVADLLVSPKK